MARIRIFTGHFGSGKTEIALNYALHAKLQGKSRCLVDLDIVNPYFCSRDMAKTLQEHGVRLISAPPALANAEVTVVPPEVMVIFSDRTCDVVVDVGGDDLGAVALGQFNRYFKNEEVEMNFVINTSRPLTSTRESVMESIRSIEKASRLQVTHLVANTNLSYETTPEHVIAGDKFVADLARELALPHAFTVCRKDLLPSVEGKVSGELFGIDIYMRPPWM